MIQREKNPEYLNSFLDYSITILNKSPNSVKEYNYDLTNFLKFMVIRFKLTNETDLSKIDILIFTENDLKKITLDDIHAYISHLAIDNRSKATTRARKVSTIRIFFKYSPPMLSFNIFLNSFIFSVYFTSPPPLNPL